MNNTWKKCPSVITRRVIQAHQFCSHNLLPQPPKHLQNSRVRIQPLINRPHQHYRSQCTSTKPCHGERIPFRNAILCPGQGSQYVGMLQDYDRDNANMRSITDTAARVLGYDIIELCRTGPMDKLSHTIHTQPAIVLGTLLAFEKLKVLFYYFSM